MPSHTPASALIKLYLLDGLPWEYPTWKAITGIHNGLFPSDDTLLPGGWTRQDVNDIKSYFDRYNQLPTEDDKIKFSVSRKADGLVGREKWRTFVNKSWDKWGVHNLIVEGLRKESVHPITIMVNDGDLDDWPCASNYVSKAVETVGALLFGPEAFQVGELLPSKVRKCVIILIQRSWARIRDQVNRDKKRMEVLEATAISAFQGKCLSFLQHLQLMNTLIAFDEGPVTKSTVIQTIRSVSKWKDLAQVYGTPENISKVDDMLAELNRVLEGLGAKVPKKPTSSARKRTSTYQYICISLAI
jgi:hypothetical protein